MRRSWRWVLILLTALLVSAISLTGCSAVDQITDILYPTPTPGDPAEPPQAETAAPLDEPHGEPTPAPTVTPTFTVPAPTQTPNLIPTDRPTPAPTPESGQHLVYGRNSSIFQGDELGHNPVEVALVPQLESWAFHQGKLAIARKEYLQIVDLTVGKLSNYKVPAAYAIEYSEIYWSADGAGLLLVAMIEDDTAKELGRSIAMISVLPEDGSVRGAQVVRDMTRVIIGQYSATAGQVTFIPLGAGPEFSRVDTIDLNTGDIVSSVPIKGEGEAAFSGDGQYLLVEQLSMEEYHNGLALYDLTKLDAEPTTWLHPADSHSVSHVWSNDGQRVAFEMRDGMSFDVASEGRGVWVLDIAAKEPIQVLNEPDPTSWVVGWSPDDRDVLAYHHSVEQSYFYAIHPDGGNLRILPMEEDAEILGWMPVNKGPVDKVVMDPWRIRFLDAEGDPTAMAQVVAEYVAANVQTEETELSNQVRGYLEDVDWALGASHPSILRVADGIFVAQLPSFTIYLLESGQAQPILYGDVLIDSRLQDDALGVIFGTFSTDALQPAFALLKHQEDGAWTMDWMAQGRRDWITTNGQIRFSGEGLDELTVRGSSYGLDYDDNLVFDECRSCIQRSLQGIWKRQEDAYIRQSDLSEEATRAEIYWEMTDKTAYATVYEALRRARQDLAMDGLATEEVVEQMRNLGLLKKDLVLTVKDDSDFGILFCAHDACWEATVEQGRVVAVDQAP